MVKHFGKQEKRYGCLFTCLVIRAVDLEVAKSLETDSFINALKRFIARRGPPSDVYSDNGTSFVGADRELMQSLEEWTQSQISHDLSQKDIQWHFNPPASPHSGGIWERLVRSHKKALKVLLHGQVVTGEVLDTTFAETEALTRVTRIFPWKDDTIRVCEVKRKYGLSRCRQSRASIVGGVSIVMDYVNTGERMSRL